MGERSLEQLAGDAAAGDSEARSRLVEEVQHPVYRLALRFLGHPQDAKDATQEILVRLITHLGQVEGRARFMTREYTVAVRQLMRTLQRLYVPLGLRASPHDFRRAVPRRPRRAAKAASPRADHGLTAFDQPMPHPSPHVDEQGPRSSPGAPRASSRGETC